VKIVVQRVRDGASIVSRVEGDAQTRTDRFEGPGFVVLIGWTRADETRDPGELARAEEWLVTRVQGLRVFPDAGGRMNRALADYAPVAGAAGGGILWVPQFTLAASLESGFRPSFTDAMAPDLARARFGALTERLRAEKRGYAQIFGVFGADMDLSFTNWGPVTIPLDR